MTYVITQNCCKDASCVSACPVDCIRPSATDGSPGTQMLFIDPETCIDCGACADECPVDAVYSEFDLPEGMARFLDINAEYFRHNPLEPAMIMPMSRPPAVDRGALRVAIVGAGPAACYAAAELLGVDGVEVELFERLPTPFGLIRAASPPITSAPNRWSRTSRAPSATPDSAAISMSRSGRRSRKRICSPTITR